MTERAKPAGTSHDNARRFFREMGELARTEPDRAQRRAFFRDLKQEPEYQQAQNILTSSVPTVVENFPQVEKTIQEVEPNEPLSDAVMGGLLAAVGNHEGKALLLASMQPGIGYSSTDMQKMTYVGGKRFWKGKTNAFSWSVKSFAPIGLVTREIVDPERGLVGYELTERGNTLGVSLAGHVLAFSERHPETSLERMLSVTTSSKSLDAHSEGNLEEDNKRRAPLARYRIFSELLAGDLPARKEDLLQGIAQAYPGEPKDSMMNRLTHHLDNLSRHGIISYETTTPDTPFALFIPAKNRPEEPPQPDQHNKTLMQRIDGIMQQSETQVSPKDIFNALVEQYPNYAERSVAGLMNEISRTVQQLVRSGHVTQIGEFSKGNQSRITLTDDQRALIKDFVTVLTAFQSQDPEILAAGHREARSIVSNQDRFGALMIKSKEASGRSGDRSSQQTQDEIVDYCRAHPECTNRDLQAHFQEGGRVYTIGTIRDFTQLLRSKGVLSSEVRGKISYFTASEAPLDEETPDERPVSITIFESRVPNDEPSLEEMNEGVDWDGTDGPQMGRTL